MVNPNKVNYMKVNLVICFEVPRILHTVFYWGCERDRTKTMKEYLLDEKKMSNREFKGRFNKTMREKIEKNPSGDAFDVSLLYACIKAACRNLAAEGSEVWSKKDETKLEYLCTAIKDIRADFGHDPRGLDENEMKEKLREIEGLSLKILDTAGALYNRTPAEIKEAIRPMKACIADIIANPLDCQNVERCERDLKELEEYQKDILSRDGINELRTHFVNLESVDPVSWFTGQCQLKVKEVFTRLDVVKEKRNLMHPEAVGYEQLLTLETDDGRIPSVVVIEGEAGAGKTTLAKFMMREWAGLPGTLPTIRNLDQFDLVLYIELRNKHISKFEDLLLVLLPTAACYLRNSDLVKAVLNINVLLIADGLDESNENTYKLLNEIFKILIPTSANRLRIVLTTRPEKLSKLPLLLTDVQWVHTRLTGVAVHRRAEFVSRLHQEMISQNKSKQDTQGLVDFLKQSQSRIGEHYRLPLMLTLLTYLWAYDPVQVNSVTTSTKLYTEFHKMIQQRLQDRLFQLALGSEAQLRQKCEEFLIALYEVSLYTLLSDYVILPDDCCNRLMQVCGKLNLPPEEMCAAFLALDRKWTAQGYKTNLAAPHKSIMEFYACHHIFYYMHPPVSGDRFQNELLDLLTKYGKSLEEINEHLNIVQTYKKQPMLSECIKNLFALENENKYLSDYQNVLIHFCGLLADKNHESLKQLAKELVELLEKANLKNARWLDVVWEADCHDDITQLVATKIYSHLIIRDGHTRAAIEIFPYLDTLLPIRIVLDCEVRHIPHLAAMLDLIADRDCDVELYLNHQWKDSDFGTSDNLLGRIINKRCRLSSFAGNLENLATLPDTIEKLKITIRDNAHAKVICPGLESLKDRTDLEYLGLHISPVVDLDFLREIPILNEYKRECGTLWISNVTDRHIEWACKVARKLLPKDCKYNNIRFPRSSLSMEKCRKLIEYLAELGVQIRTNGGVVVSSSIITYKQEIELRFLTQNKLHCEFDCSDESNIW